jgi:prepilin-type N-terminal cleavage/methylation domain-containing protein
MNFALVQSPSQGPRRVQSGFTLVEVMVATVLLSFIILSILSAMIGAYRIAAKARYNDHARYVIKSFADQFLTQQTTDTSGNVLPLFLPTSQTGYGLSWTNYDGSTASGGTNQSTAPASIPVLLGDNTGAPITAYVSRAVWYVFTSGTQSGQPTSLPQNGSAGYVLRADFTVTYDNSAQTYVGLPLHPLTLTVLRSVP